MRKSLTLAVAALCIAPGLAFGQAPSNKAAPSTGLAQRTSATAVRMSIVNGLVQTINNTRQVTMDLQWNLLPAGDSLSDLAASFGVQPQTIEISNSDLKQGIDWTKKLKPEVRDQLLAALFLNPKDNDDWGGGREATAQKSIKNFTDVWNSDSGWGLPLRSGSISVPDFLASQRDYFYLLALLRSNGISCNFSIKDADVKGPNPRIASDDIHWEVKLYPLPLTKDHKLYRCSIRAKEDHFPVLFVNGDQTSATLRAKFSFIRHMDETGHPNDILSGIAGQYLNTTIQEQKDLPALPSEDSKLPDAADSLAPSSLETTLKLVGGVDLTDVISRGLLGGSAQSSLISGGLFGRGRVTGMTGISTDLWRRGRDSLGYALGVLPDDQNSLFTGLSAQFGDLMLIPGFIAKGTSDNQRTAFKGVLGVSFDLGRVLGSKKDNFYTLENATDDPTWVPSDAVFAETAGIRYTLQATGPNALGISPRMAVMWKVDDATNAVVALQPTDTFSYAYVKQGTVNLLAPLGYNLVKLNKNLVTGGDTPQELQTAIVGPLDMVSVRVGKTFQQKSTPDTLQQDAITIKYRLEPSAGLVTSIDRIDYRKLADAITADQDEAKALFAMLPADEQAMIQQAKTGDLDAAQKAAVMQALNLIIAGPLLSETATEGGEKPFAAAAARVLGNGQTPPNIATLNSKRVAMNRRILQTILPGAFLDQL